MQSTLPSIACPAEQQRRAASRAHLSQGIDDAGSLRRLPRVFGGSGLRILKRQSVSQRAKQGLAEEKALEAAQQLLQERGSQPHYLRHRGGGGEGWCVSLYYCKGLTRSYSAEG